MRLGLHIAKNPPYRFILLISVGLMSFIYFQTMFLHNPLYRWCRWHHILWKTQAHSSCTGSHQRLTPEIFWFVLIAFYQSFSDAHDHSFDLFIRTSSMFCRRSWSRYIPPVFASFESIHPTSELFLWSLCVPINIYGFISSDVSICGINSLLFVNIHNASQRMR